MAKVYNFDSGSLVIQYRDISFDLKLRNPITQVYGDSAAGKTLLVNCIKNEKKNNRFNNECADNLSNIFVFDDAFSVEDLSKITNSLIIVDRCDLILSEGITEYIACDRSNHYLLFSRTGLPLGISPNNYGEFVCSEGVVRVHYKYSEMCWF